MKITKPMLAVALEDVTQLQFPVLVTPKLDGIRCLKIDGKAVSRTLKPIPNHFIRTWIEANCPDGFDGEIMSLGRDFNGVQSIVMTEEGEPDFHYWVFDYVKDGLDKPYKDRIEDLRQWMGLNTNHTRLVFLLPTSIPDVEQLLYFEKETLLNRYEGVMIRSLNGPYKCGRSTLKEGSLLKLKRFKDAEACIYGVVERLHNANEAFKDELGHTKRSSHKANKVPTGTLGAFMVATADGTLFEIGTGFDDAQRLEYWENRASLNGLYVKYKYQELSKDGVPRFPVFLGFRHKEDL